MRITKSALLIAGLTAACAEDFPSATDTSAITPAPKYSLWPVGFGTKPLEHSNANKIVTGRFNSLHAVYQSGLIVRYGSSLDGASWTSPINLSGADPSMYPAIAADTTGTIAVVWVANIGANGLGTIRYAYKPAASTTWTTSTLITSGTEPAIVARNGVVHLAWTTFQMAQYTSFPTISPPSTPLSGGEVLESTSCPNTGFRKPSITLIQNPCNSPIPRVAYLYYSDEQATSGVCQSLQTQVGPHLCERNNTTSTWAMIYDGTSFDTTASSSVDPISCSLTSNFNSGDTFLAWSDEQTGVARTMLTHGAGVSWTTVPFDDQRHHVHLRAASSNNAPATRFRFAWTGGGSSWDEFFNWDTYYDTATWTGAAPVWTDQYHLSAYGGATGRPQGLFWSRCASGAYSTTNAYFEAEQVCASEDIATDLSTTSPCPPTTIQPVGIHPCRDWIVAVAALNTPHGPHTVIDTAELGSVMRFGRSSAVISTAEGGTVTASWPAGTTLISSSEEGFTVAAPKSAVRFSSTDVKFRVQDFGTLVEYELTEEPAAPPVCSTR
jgi:hypothetical protein